MEMNEMVEIAGFGWYVIKLYTAEMYKNRHPFVPHPPLGNYYISILQLSHSICVMIDPKMILYKLN